ncbi:MAG: peptidylprolyl isomerase [Clostridia bacterium]|nr:peptidylprolyl isomerase [Clostridia bacterium]
MKKGIKLLFISLAVSFIAGQTSFAEENKLQPVDARVELNTAPVYWNNKPLDLSTIIYNGRLYIPMRNICYYFNSDLVVDSKNKVVNIKLGKGTNEKNKVKESVALKGSQKVKLYPNAYQFKADGYDAYIDSILYENRTFIPVRYFSEIFNKKVEWDSKKKCVYISDVKDTYIGSVGDAKITQREFEYHYNLTLKQVSSQTPDGKVSDEEKDKLKQKVFDDIVTMKIMDKKAAENKIVIDEKGMDEINQRLQSVVTANNGIGEVRKYLGETGAYFNEFVEFSKQAYIYYQLSTKLTQSLTPGEEDYKAFYEKNKSNFVEPEQVRAKHILIATMDTNTRERYSEEKKAEAKKKAEEILAKVKEGGDFDKLVSEFGEDPGMKSNPEGYKFTRNDPFIEEFKNAAFALKVGEVSGIVETEYGYHILKLEEKIPEKQLQLDDVKAQIKSTVEMQIKEDYMANLMKKWKAEIKIVNNVK